MSERDATPPESKADTYPSPDDAIEPTAAEFRALERTVNSLSGEIGALWAWATTLSHVLRSAHGIDVPSPEGPTPGDPGGRPSKGAPS